jgi:hypothetical protein
MAVYFELYLQSAHNTQLENLHTDKTDIKPNKCVFSSGDEEILSVF